MSCCRSNINRGKHNRVEFEPGTTCIEIEEGSFDGKFVKLLNSGTKVSNFQGYKIRSASSFPSRKQGPIDEEFQSQCVVRMSPQYFCGCC